VSGMHAAVLHGYGQHLEVEDRPGLEPGPGEIVLDVEACGVCGSDRFLISGGFGSSLPIVPGHEAAGIVRELGEGVDGPPVGTLAAVYYIQHCGACTPCQQGRVNLCDRILRMGVDVDGAFATQVRVPASCVLPVSGSLDPAIVAVLTDAVGTGYHALTRVARVQPGETVLIFGVGGIGSNAVQVARRMGARVAAISRQEAKLELARHLGADAAFAASDDVIAQVREWAGGTGPAVVIQTVGSAVVDRQAVEAVGSGGRVVFVGASQASFEIRATELIWREAQLLGSRGFVPDDIREVVALYEAGELDLDHLITRRRPLAEVNEALADLGSERALRTVIEPQR
jgi:2-desacetyl-2-hydroxyethyl bacteriochlorophyllide A dehydrogenase